MQWYKTGTVSVTNGSKVITGIGTSFITIAGVTSGDAFTLDGSKFYEIATVDSETQVTLVENYAEATQSDQNYAIDRRSSNSLSNDALAARVAQRFTEWQQFVDQVNDWKAGVVGGGPNSDGEYPLTDPLGVEHLLPCPAQLESNLSTYNDSRMSYMTEAEAMALAEKQRQEFAGSGSITSILFDDFYAPELTANTLPILGADNNVNGFKAALQAIDVLLPDAPFATNLVTNGTFDTDTSGWSTGSWYAGMIKLDSSTGYVISSQEVTGMIVGRKYLLEWTQSGDRTRGVVVYGDASFDNHPDTDDYYYPSVSGTYREIITANNTTVTLGLVGQYTDSGDCYFDNVSIIDLGKVIRKDLVFLETFVEDTALKGMRYPYGLIQYQGATDPATGLSTTAGSFSGYDTYSLFSEDWQSAGDLVGKGLVIANMSDDETRKFISDPNNGIFLGADGKEYQIRHRIRVIEGVGPWGKYIDPQGGNYVFASDVSAKYIKPKGSNIEVTDYGSSGLLYVTKWHAYAANTDSWDIGSFKAASSAGDASLISYKGLCFATPIALVHRRNQGAYHPVFNLNGTKIFRTDSDTVQRWYEEANGYVNSTSDCFATSTEESSTDRYLRADSGAIGSSYNGRPDGKYFDAIYESDIEDLRNSARTQDLQRTLECEFNNLVNGEIRGWEYGVKSVVHPAYADGNPSNAVYIPDNMLDTYSVGQLISVYDITSGTLIVSRKRVTEIYASATYGASYIRTETFYTRTAGNLYLIAAYNNNALIPAKTLLHCDIIGDPANYYRGQDYTNTGASQTVTIQAGEVVWNRDGDDIEGLDGHFYQRVWAGTVDLATRNYTQTSDWTDLGTDWNGAGSWLTNGIAGTPLLVGEEGEDYIPDGTSKTWKASRKIKTGLLALTSSDNGATWSVTTAPIADSSNKLVSGTMSSGIIRMYFYLTEASPTEDYETPDSILLNGDVIATDSSRLGDYLSGKVMTGSSPNEECTTLKKVDGVWTHTASSLTSGVKVSFKLVAKDSKQYLEVAGEEIDTTDDGAIDTEVNRRLIPLPYFVREDA